MIPSVVNGKGTPLVPYEELVFLDERRYRPVHQRMVHPKQLSYLPYGEHIGDAACEDLQYSRLRFGKQHHVTL